jgi:hypothetical protein
VVDANVGGSELAKGAETRTWFALGTKGG